MNKMKNNMKTLFYLKRNQPKKNGDVTIMIRITIDGVQTQFSSKLEIKPELWDTKLGKAIGKNTATSNFNRELESIKANISMHYLNTSNKKGYATPEDVKNAYFGLKNRGNTILSYFNEYIEDYKSKIGKTSSRETYIRYQLTKDRLKDFMKEKYKVSDMQIEEINIIFLENFYLHFRNKFECSNNTTMKFMQRFHSIITYAINTGLTMVDPFLNYKFKYTRVDREVLTQHEINLMCNKEFVSERLTQVRDVYLFCCYTGLAYIDVAELKDDNIKLAFDNHLWIMSKRHKTNVNFNVRLLDIPKVILEKYRGKQKNNLVLPVISNQKMNDYLKEIAVVCGIDKNITFHTSRHTFATTIGLSNGVPIETISKMLGHTNIKTTQIYAKITDLKISNDMEILAQKMNNQSISI